MLDIAGDLVVDVAIPTVNITTLGDLEEVEIFPDDLTSVSYIHLGQLFTNYTSFLAFVNEQLAIFKLQKHRLTLDKKRRKAIIIFSAKGIKMQKQAAVYRDKQVNAYDDRLFEVGVEIAAYYNMMWTLKEYLRAVEFERDRRGMKVKADG